MITKNKLDGGVNMGFRSNAEEIRHYCKELLEDGQEHTLSEMKEYTKKHSERGYEFTEAMYAGSIKTMIDSGNGQYIIMRRGVYKKSDSNFEAVAHEHVQVQLDISLDDNKDNLVAEYLTEIFTILDEASDKAKNAYKGNMFELTDEEVATIRTIGKKVIDGLSDIKKNVGGK